MEMTIIFSIMLIGMAALLSQWVAWALKLPSILFLLLAGLLLGPVFDIIHADQLFGSLLFPVVSIAVAIILFEGSLKLQFQEIKAHRGVVMHLVSVGFLLSAGMIAVAAHFLFALSWQVAMLFGVLASISGPTVIMPLLRSVRPNKTVETILRWEGLLIDPIGAVVAVLVFSFLDVYGPAEGLRHVWWSFIEIILSATVLGSGVGYFLGRLIRGHWVPEYLRNLTVLVLVILVYVCSEWLVEGSGLLAVTIMGVFLANMQGVHIEDILDFKENLSILLISGIFILLASRLDLSALSHLGLAIIILLLLIQFVIRPVAVMLSTYNASLTFKEKVLISWIFPRGIVGAAVAALYSVKLQAEGSPAGQMMVALVFAVIICTVIWQSFTARVVAKGLGLAMPEPHGFMIIGANVVARALGKALQAEGYTVLLASSHWEQISIARRDGLNGYYGNPISEHADRHLDLVNIGKVLTITNNTQHNVLANLRYQHEFGKGAIFHLQTSYEMKHAAKHQIAAKHSGRILFDPQLDFTGMTQRIQDGAMIVRTVLTDSLDFDAYKQAVPAGAILLFAISPRGRIVVVEQQDQVINAAKDWVMLTLLPAALSSKRG